MIYEIFTENTHYTVEADYFTVLPHGVMFFANHNGKAEGIAYVPACNLNLVRRVTLPTDYNELFRRQSLDIAREQLGGKQR